MASIDETGPLIDGLLSQVPDIDPDETGEWVESLDGLIDEQGRPARPLRAAEPAASARASATSRSRPRSTRPYVNTIGVHDEPYFPGDEVMERRYRSWIRWNAAVMVTRAQRPGIGVGGHISSYASVATLYEVGLNHFFRGKDHPGGGDQVYFQGHASPGVYARAFLEGRLSAAPARRVPPGALAPGRRPAVLPAPAPHAGPVGVPDGVDGPRPGVGHLPGVDQPVPAPRGIKDTSQQDVWAFLGDGEMDEPESRGMLQLAAPAGPGQPDVRRQLQPAAPRRPGARQRQDHPGARGAVPRRRLERHQGHLGPRVGHPAQRRQGPRARQPDEHHARRRLPDVQGRRRRVHPRALLRPRPAHQAARREDDRRRDLGAQARRARLPQDLRRLQGRAASTPGSRRSSSRTPSRATAWAPASPGATRRTR